MECAVSTSSCGRAARWPQGRAEAFTFKEIAMHSLFQSGGPIAASHGFVFDGPGFDPKRAASISSRSPISASTPSARIASRSTSMGHRRRRSAARLVRA